MRNHTPGPWTVGDSNYPVSSLAVCSQRGTVSRMASTKPSFEQRANARLMAAAPTMYEYVKLRSEAGDSEASAILEAMNASR